LVGGKLIDFETVVGVLLLALVLYAVLHYHPVEALPPNERLGLPRADADGLTPDRRSSVCSRLLLRWRCKKSGPTTCRLSDSVCWRKATWSPHTTTSANSWAAG
jgi:hypothetical protein